MNCYTTHTANQAVPMTHEEYLNLRSLLDIVVPAERGELDDEEDYNDHGLGLEYHEPYKGDPGGAYLYTNNESSCGDYLPKEFLEEFGRLIDKAGLPWLGVGFAHFADKPQPGSHGGGRCRIYPDGKLLYPREVWERDE